MTYNKFVKVHPDFYTPIPLVDSDEDPDNVVQKQAVHTHKIPIPIVADEPIHTIVLPSRATGWRSYDLTLGAPAVKILNEDTRRKRAILLVTDNAGSSAGARIGQSQAEAQSGYGFILGLASGVTNRVSSQLEYTSYTCVWATAITASCVISVLNEQWAL